MVKGRAILCGLFICGVPWAAQAQDAYPRLDVLACHAAVDGLQPQYRDRLRGQCLSIAADHCEGKASGSMLACLKDVEDVLSVYVLENRSLLPEAIEATPFRQNSYVRMYKELAAFDLAAVPCAEGTVLERQVRRLIAVQTQVTTLRDAAYWAEVTLPQ